MVLKLGSVVGFSGEQLFFPRGIEECFFNS
jgi:hypothetical protein